MTIWLAFYFALGAAAGRLLKLCACRYCSTVYGSRNLPAELLTGTAFALCGLHFKPVLPLALMFVLTSCLILISLIDYKTQIIPDRLVGVIAVSGVLYNLLYAPQSVVDMLLGGAVGFVVMLVIFVISRGGMGGGDVKLSTAVGLWLGVEGTLLFLLLAFIMGGVISLLLLVSGAKSKGDAIPFGPFLCFAAFVTVLYQPFLLNFYWQLFLF